MKIGGLTIPYKAENKSCILSPVNICQTVGKLGFSFCCKKPDEG